MENPKKRRSWKPPKLTFLESSGIKTGLLFGVLTILGLVVALADLSPDLSHIDNQMLSGSAQGNYHRIVAHLAERAASQKGKLRNIRSEGSVTNLERLAAEAESCDIQFALVQDGLDWSVSGELRLLGRLWKAESVFFLGKNADEIRAFTDLRGLKVGIGPKGSGSALVACQIFDGRDFNTLGLTLENHGISEQLALLDAGELDLGVFVIDEDAQLIDDAVRKRGLRIVGFDHADVIARRHPFLRTGRVAAGQYDPLRILPKEDKSVLRIATLVLTNGCASRSQTLGLLSLLAEEFPDFIRHNRDTPNATGLEMDPAAKAFFDSEGVDIIDAYAPWFGDVMPPTNWVHIIMGVSILFNLMGLWNRFRIWRLDANRVKVELSIPLIFGEGHDNDSIQDVEPGPEHLEPERRERLDDLIEELDKLARRCRKQSLSVLVPMGGELYYRYQEDTLEQTLVYLRAFRRRLAAFERGATG